MDFSCFPSLFPQRLSAFTVPVAVELDDSYDFSWLCNVRRATSTWRRCEFRRIEICDIEDVRYQREGAAIILLDAAGYGECH